MEQAKEELFNLQRMLAKFCKREALDPVACSVFRGHPPIWLNNASVFPPLLEIYERDLEELNADVKAKQKMLRKLARIYRLELRIEALKESIHNLVSGSAKVDKRARVLILDGKIGRIQSYRSDVVSEIGFLTRSLERALEDLKRLEAIRDGHSEQLRRSTEMTKDYRKTLARLRRIAQNVNTSKVELAHRSNRLQQLVTKLQQNNIDRSNLISRLEEKWSVHQNLLDSYQALEKQIRDHEGQQDGLLGKLGNALKFAEDASTEAQRQRMVREDWAYELERIRDFSENTVKQFEISLEHRENLVRKELEKVLESIQEQSRVLEREKNHLLQEKDAIEKRMDTTQCENSLLRNRQANHGFSEFVETMAGIKAELEAGYLKKSRLVSLNDNLKHSVDLLKAKQIRIVTEGKKTQVELNKKRGAIHLELDVQKEVYKKILEKNAKVSGESQRIRDEIVENAASIRIELDTMLGSKRREIEALQVRVQTAQEANAKKISEMQGIVIGFRDHANKWKAAVQNIEVSANDAVESAEMEKGKIKERILKLEGDLERRVLLREKCELMLTQLGNQISALKQAVNSGRKTQREHHKLISALMKEQEVGSLEKGRHQAILQEYDIRIQGIERSKRYVEQD
jgi:chromosome segregation ATPase